MDGSSKHTPSGHRLRIGRVSQPGGIYLVTMVCHSRRPLFHNLENGRAAVSALRETVNLCDTWCFVIMPDHVHWMVQLKPGIRLRTCVHKAKSLTTRQLRSKGSCLESVWQKGFHDRAIRSDEDIRSVARYVTANPLRAGLVSAIEHYSLWDAAWVDSDQPL